MFKICGDTEYDFEQSVQLLDFEWGEGWMWGGEETSDATDATPWGGHPSPPCDAVSVCLAALGGDLPCLLCKELAASWTNKKSAPSFSAIFSLFQLQNTVTQVLLLVGGGGLCWIQNPAISSEGCSDGSYFPGLVALC
jgi:hypothetical protein